MFVCLLLFVAGVTTMSVREMTTPKPQNAPAAAKDVREMTTPKPQNAEVPALVARVLDFHETNPLETEYGPLEEGDILRTAEDRQAHPLYRWENHQYNYVISPESEPDREAIERAVDFWRENTCIRFTEVGQNSRLPRVKFIKSSGCWSQVGCVAQYVANREQQLSLGHGCTAHGTVTHEIAHSLGLYHEQSRPDSGSYIRILTENIIPGREGNFRVASNALNYSVEYDLGSVMHYGTAFFSRNGQPTILTLDPTLQGLIGQRQGPTFRDVAVVNRMYRCEELCARPPRCLNGGYVSADCTCHCPPNTSGASCDHVTGPYYPAPSCGGRVTQPGQLTSPGWPGVYPTGSDCTWWVRAPPGRRARVTFRQFQIMSPLFGCLLEYMEVREAGVASSISQYCGSDLQGRTFTASGPEGDLIFRFKAYTVNFGGRGFTADVSFV